MLRNDDDGTDELKCVSCCYAFPNKAEGEGSDLSTTTTYLTAATGKTTHLRDTAYERRRYEEGS